MEIKHLSAFCGNRHLSILSRKRAVQYFLAGIKDEARIFKEYGLSRKLLWKNRQWYWKYFQKPHILYKNGILMKNDKKALEKRIKELEKMNSQLRKQLDWEETKSLLYKKLIEIAEEDLGIDLEKKDGAKQFRK